MIRRRRKVRSWGAAEKQHIEMFLVANFVLSRKRLFMKRFFLNIMFFKRKWFSSSFLENAIKNAMG